MCTLWLVIGASHSMVLLIFVAFVLLNAVLILTTSSYSIKSSTRRQMGIPFWGRHSWVIEEFLITKVGAGLRQTSRGCNIPRHEGTVTTAWRELQERTAQHKLEIFSKGTQSRESFFLIWFYLQSIKPSQKLANRELFEAILKFCVLEMQSRVAKGGLGGKEDNTVHVVIIPLLCVFEW